MEITETIVAGLLLAVVTATASHFASDISEAIDKVAPDGVPYAACVEDALETHGITAVEELQAHNSNTSTPASADIQACVSDTQIPDWLTEALTHKE